MFSTFVLEQSGKVKNCNDKKCIFFCWGTMWHILVFHFLGFQWNIQKTRLYCFENIVNQLCKSQVWAESKYVYHTCEKQKHETRIFFKDVLFYKYSFLLRPRLRSSLLLSRWRCVRGDCFLEAAAAAWGKLASIGHIVLLGYRSIGHILTFYLVYL